MKTNNATVNRNNIVFYGSQTQYVFHKTKLVRLQKKQVMQLFSN